MEGYTQITLDEWTQWKEDIRTKLAEAAGNFVYIGYRLKQIRDSGMFGGCTDVFEFAQKEYGLGKSTVSRFIAINEKFSEGGDSLELKAEYRAIGSSKLAEMLTLPDSECQLITERTTVREIRELKQFGRQQVPEGGGGRLSPLQECLVDYFRDKKDMLNAVVRAVYVYADAGKEAAELMNPSGYATHKKGICFLFMYDYSTGVKAKLLTEPEPVTMAWKDVLMDVYGIFGYIYENGEEDIHRAYYGGLEKEDDGATENGSPKTEEIQKNQGVENPVAMSQQEYREDSAAAAVGESTKTQEEEQLFGQMSVEDYPEVLPADYEEVKEDAGNADSSGTEGGSSPAGEGSSAEAADDDDSPDGLRDADDSAGSGDMLDPDRLSAMPGVLQDVLKLWEDIRTAKIRVVAQLDHLFMLAPDGSNPEDLTKSEDLKKTYDRAVDLAAAIERLMIAKQREQQDG